MFQCFLWDILCLTSDSTETIISVAFGFYDAIVDSGFVLINHFIEISSCNIIVNYFMFSENLQ